MYYLIIIAVIFIDQIIKNAVENNMELNQVIPVIDGFLDLKYIYNTGAAFSMFEDSRVFLIVFPGIIMLGMLVFFVVKKKALHPIASLGISLIIGGGVGNLIDRIMTGKVTDYISVGSFPVFNFADICVCCGCGLVIIYLLFIDGKKGRIDKDNGNMDNEKKNEIEGEQ